MKSIAEAARSIGGQPMFKLLQKAGELERQGRRILHFEIGDPIFDTPEAIVQSAIQALKSGKTHYTHSSGLLELKEAIAQSSIKELGFQPSLDQIVVLPANAIIYFLLRCVVNPGEEVLVPDPGFSTYYSAIDFVGAKAVHVPLLEEQSFRMDPRAIRQRLSSKTRLLIINSPQNPTGSVISQRGIEEIAALASKEDIYLLSDEVYRKMHLEEQKIASPSSLDFCRERTIVLNSFSKSHAMSGFRLGYAIGPEAVIEKMGLLVQTVLSCMPPFIQAAGIAALNGAGDQFVREMMKKMRINRDLMVEGLNRLPGVSCTVPEGAFYVFPNIKQTGMTSAEFADAMLDQAGVALLPGTAFGPGGEGYVRLCYAATPEVIHEALAQMSKALAQSNALKVPA